MFFRLSGSMSSTRPVRVIVPKRIFERPFGRATLESVDSLGRRPAEKGPSRTGPLADQKPNPLLG